MSEALHWTTVGVMVFVLLLQLFPAWAKIRKGIPKLPDLDDLDVRTKKGMESFEVARRAATSLVARIFRASWEIDVNQHSAFVKKMDSIFLPSELDFWSSVVRIVSITLLAMLAIARFAAGEPILNLFAR